MLITLPGYYRNSKESILSISKKIISHSENKIIIIVGHSLGAAFACQLVKYIKNNKIILCLSSMPINIPRIYITFRLFAEKILRTTSSFLPVTYIPIFIRSKLITNYSNNNLLSFLMKKDEYVTLLCKHNNVMSINIGCGYMDMVAGGIKTQKKLVNELNNKGVISEFFNFGFTGHYPQQLNRAKYARWLLKVIDSNIY